jgi:hypothetical protein
MKHNLLAVILLGAGITLAPSVARAASISATLDEFTGADAQVNVTITEVGGNLQFALHSTLPVGDITGFWANLSPYSAGTVVAAAPVANWEFNENNVNDLGNGVLLNGGGTPAPLDFGVRFTKPGDGSQTDVTFTVTGLSLSQLENQTFGARIQAIGNADAGSSKLSGPGGPIVPGPGGRVPDASSTATLLGMSLFGVEWLRRRMAK